MAVTLRRIVRYLYDRYWRGPRGYGKPQPAESWDRTFASGSWDFLTSEAEKGRYGVIRDFALGYKSPLSLLDIGSGIGVLRSTFVDGELSAYTGLDISIEAVKKCQGANYFCSEFIVGDFDTFAPDRTYDVIVFNESIYYSKDPPALLHRYWPHIAPGGMCIVSINDYDARSRAQWRRLDRAFQADASRQVINEKGQLWDIKVYIKSQTG
ncbi:MAG: methyltransferase domain-containing protein [Alphaproteobacteria bacterium]